MRCMNLADSLLMRGHQVRILSSRFYHQRKVHRKKHQLLDIQEKSLQYTLIDSPGYLSNISLARLFDHAVLAFNLLIYLVKESSSPHVCFIGSPPLEYAFIATLWAKVRGIPVILDVKDLWPDLIWEGKSLGMRIALRILLFPYKLISVWTLKLATVFTAPTQSYIDWMSTNAGIQNRISSLVIPLTSARRVYPTDVIENSTKNWGINHGVSVNSGHILTFIGSFMSVFDYDYFLYTYDFLDQLSLKFLLVLAGDGEYLNTVKNLFTGKPSVVFPGWISGAEVTSLYNMSCCTLVPYKNISNYNLNIPNKIVDSIAHEVPFVTSVQGEVNQLTEQYNLGFCTDNVVQFAHCVASLVLNKNIRNNMAVNCRRAYVDHFDNSNNYSNATSMIESIPLIKQRFR